MTPGSIVSIDPMGSSVYKPGQHGEFVCYVSHDETFIFLGEDRTDEDIGLFAVLFSPSRQTLVSARRRYLRLKKNS